MRHIGRVFAFGAGLAVLLAFASSDIAAAKKKDKAKDKAADYPAATDADYKAIQKVKELPGKLVTIDGMNVTLRVDYPHYEANPKYRPPKVTNPNQAGYNALANQQFQMWRTYNDIMTQQQKLLTAKNPREYQQAMQRLNNDMIKLQQNIMQMNNQMIKAAAAGQKLDPNNMPFIVVTNTKDFDLEIQEKVVYRKLILPFEYDDTGNVKTYTEKEKAELRGDDKTKPGYTAKLEEFQPGQEVKLYLTPPKKKDKDKEKDKDPDADKDKDKDKEKMPEEVLRPTVNMIVMTKDNPAGLSPGEEKKKKK
jgi:hypothetical protein